MKIPKKIFNDLRIFDSRELQRLRSAIDREVQTRRITQPINPK